jgi:probable HAF family extracellular repeat protein
VCRAGACVGGDPVTCGYDTCHPGGACQPSSGTCLNPYVAGPSCPYLPVTFLDPTADQLNDTLVDINDLGTAVGWSFGVDGPDSLGDVDFPFFTNPTFPEPLPFMGSSDRLFPVSINANGFILALGGTDPGPDWSTLIHTVLFRPDHTASSPIRLLSYPSALTNGLDSNGEPEIAGIMYADGGAFSTWHFDGDTNDAGPNPWYRGDFVPPSAPVYVPGHTGQALQFDGGEGIRTGTVYEPIWSQLSYGLSLSAWVKPTGPCPAAPAVLLQAGSFFELALACGPGGATSVTGGASVTLSGNPPLVPPAGSLTVGAWNHVALSWNESFIRTYVNGALVGVFPLQGTLVGWTPYLTMGANLNGALDDVVMYGSPLSDADVAHLYAGDTAGLYQFFTAAWFHHRDGETKLIPPIAGTPLPTWTQTFGMNEAGDIVGFAALADGRQHALYFTEADGLRDLNTLLPANSGWFLSQAIQINGRRQIVGRGDHAGAHRTFRFDVPAGKIQDLGVLQYPYDQPDQFRLPDDINQTGTVVGGSFDTWPFWAYRAFVYTDALGLTDLNTLVDPTSGWILREARAINDSNDIVGYASNESMTAFRGFKMHLGSTAVGTCSGAADGTPCNDGNACTQGDVCRAEICQSGISVTCLAFDACHGAGTCSPLTGACFFPRINNSTCSARSGRIEAESFDDWSGFGAPSASAVTPLDAGAWLAFNDVDLGTPGQLGRFNLSILGTPGDKHVEVHLDAPDGLLIADLLTLPSTLDVAGTGAQSTPLLAPVSGLHRVVLVARSPNLGSFDWFSFDDGVSGTIVGSYPPGYHHTNPGQNVDLDNLPPLTEGEEEEDVLAMAAISGPGAVDIAPGQSRLLAFTTPETLRIQGQVTWSPASASNVAISIVDAQGAALGSGQPCPHQAGCARAAAPAVTAQAVAIRVTNNDSQTITANLAGQAVRTP